MTSISPVPSQAPHREPELGPVRKPLPRHWVHFPVPSHFGHLPVPPQYPQMPRAPSPGIWPFPPQAEHTPSRHSELPAEPMDNPFSLPSADQCIVHEHLPVPPQALQTSTFPCPPQILQTTLPDDLLTITFAPQYTQWAVFRFPGTSSVAPQLGHFAATSLISDIESLRSADGSGALCRLRRESRRIPR